MIPDIFKKRSTGRRILARHEVIGVILLVVAGVILILLSQQNTYFWAVISGACSSDPSTAVCHPIVPKVVIPVG
jgi:drug/metabolite transporter (DMT)-like permease